LLTPIRRLMREDYMPGRRVHQIDDHSGSNVETGTDGRVNLRNNHNLSTFRHSQMARLVYLMCDLLMTGRASMIMRLVGGCSWASLNSRNVNR
jgi:hypothetical protein